MRINIDHLIDSYEQMIRSNPEDATIYEVGAITAELVLEGLKQQREDLRTIRNSAIEEYRKLLDDNTEWHPDSLGISSRYVCIEDINYFARMLKKETNK